MFQYSPILDDPVSGTQSILLFPYNVITFQIDMIVTFIKILNFELHILQSARDLTTSRLTKFKK